MKQTNNAIKFLMAQYRAIFKNANIAMLAAIAASALAAGQAQAAAISDWNNVSGGSLDGTQDQTITIAQKGSVENKKGFDLTVTSGTHTIQGDGKSAAGVFTVAEGKPSSIKLEASGQAGQNTFTIGAGDANKNATVTIDSFTNKKGTLAIQGNAAAAGKTSALNAKTISIGVESAAADDAIVTVSGHGILKATGTADGEGLLIGKGAKITVEANGTLDATKITMTSGTVSNAGTFNAGTLDLSGGDLKTSANLKADKFNITGGTVTLSGAANTIVVGSATSTIELNGEQAKITDANKGGTVKANELTLTKGTIAAAEDLIIDATTFNANGGSITVASGGKKLTLKGNSVFSGSSVENDSGTLTIEGSATFADGTLKVDAKSGSIVLSSASADAPSTLNVSATELKSVLKGGLKSSGAGVSVLNIGGESAIDLSTAGANVVADDGKFNAKLTTEGDSKLLIKGVSGSFTKTNTLDAEDTKKVSLAFDTLTLGSGDFSLVSGAGVQAGKLLTIKDGTGTLKIEKGSLVLNGTSAGEVKGKINLEGKAKADATLTVTAGKWSVGDLTLTSGNGTVGKDATLTVGGALTAKNDSTLTVDGVLSTVGSGSLAFKEAADSALTIKGKFELDEGDLLDKGSLKADALKAEALAGSGTIKIDNKTALTEKQFTDLQKGFANFKGLFEMNVDITAPETLTTTNAIGNLKTDQYDNKTLNVSGSESISKNYSVGNAVVNAEEDLKLAAGGSLSLNNPQAEKGNGNFVSKKSGEALVVGNVQFTDSGNSLTLAGTGNIGAISTNGASKGVINVGNTDAAGNVTVVKGTAGNNIGEATNTVKEVNVVKGSLTVESGSVFADNFTMMAGTSVDVNGNITTSSLDIQGGVLEVTDLVLKDASKAELNGIDGGAVLNLNSLSIGKNQALLVGEAGQGDELGSNAEIYTNALTMNDSGASIFVDPNYGTGASLFATNNIGADNATVSGQVGIGSNSAFGVGFESMAAFKDVVGDYLTVNGGFDENGVKNALVLNKGITVASGNGISVDSTLTSTDYTNKVAANTVALGDGAALVLTDKAFGADKTGAAITFAADGTVKADAKSKVVLLGEFDANDSALKLAVKNDGKAATITDTLVIEYAGGLLLGEKNQDGTYKLVFQEDKQAVIYDGVSRPVADAIVAKLKGEFKDKSAAGYRLVSDLIATGNYKAIDAAAHAATYAGAQQAAVAAVTTMADAMFGRVGAVGVEAASISATGSQANGGVWLTPMYKSVDSDGFNAEGASYGADVDLSGVAFGTDTVNGNMRFGAVFNIGSGDAEGKGNGNGLKDEFDYYGFGIYSAMGFGNFALVGDASMTVISHEVEGLGLRGKADTTAVTMGVTGQYTVATPVVDVTPHLGARFIRLNTDSYDLVSANCVEGTTDFDVQNVFSVPLGVTLSKGFTTGGWTLAPSADLTVAFNTGDTEAKSNTFIAGKNIGLNTEVLDEVQYGVTLGLGAQYGAFGTSFGINYTGSSNTDSFGVNAQARYMF